MGVEFENETKVLHLNCSDSAFRFGSAKRIQARTCNPTTSSPGVSSRWVLSPAKVSTLGGRPARRTTYTGQEERGDDRVSEDMTMCKMCVSSIERDTTLQRARRREENEVSGDCLCIYRER